MTHSVFQSSSQGRFSTGPSTSPTLQRVDLKRASHADIAKRAFQKYQARGGIHGFDREDWAASERELVAESARHLRP